VVRRRIFKLRRNKRINIGVRRRISLKLIRNNLIEIKNRRNRIRWNKRKGI